MDTHLDAALQALRTENTDACLIELVMALQEMSCRLDENREESGRVLRRLTPGAAAKSVKAASGELAIRTTWERRLACPQFGQTLALFANGVTARWNS